jgi:Abortive infection alpha
VSDDKKAPVQVDIGLRASAELKAEVPSKSVGRLVDALTDAIRPFTEARGLRADQIRLQREDVLIQIAEKARNRAATEGSQLLPVPPKMLVPFLEKASLEIDDEELKERWASLLLAASTAYESLLLSFVDILSRISSQEAKLLEEVYDGTKDIPMDGAKDYIESNRIRVETNCRKLNTVVIRRDQHEKLFRDFVAETPLTLGRILGGNTRSQRDSIQHQNYPSEQRGTYFDSVSILERERLVQLQTASPEGINIRVRYFDITYLGIKFLTACRPPT